MDFLLIVLLSPASHVTRVVDALPAIQPLLLFVQNASLEHSLVAQPVSHAINHAFSAAAVQQIAYLACSESIPTEEAVSHALRTVLFAQMPQLAQNARRDQFCLE